MDNLFIESISRWIHIVAGVMWIGHLYFFNFVNSQFAPTIDAETKKKVVPELMPRALYWFRWGAAFTWVTGVLLLMLVYYHGGIMFDRGRALGPRVDPRHRHRVRRAFIYDQLYKTVLKDPQGRLRRRTDPGDRGRSATWRGSRTSATAPTPSTSARCSAPSWRSTSGSGSGRRSSRSSGPPKRGRRRMRAWWRSPALRSKHNTYMSVPLIFTMMNAHAPWAANPLIVAGIVLVGWGATYWLYNQSKTVKGF